MDNTDNKHPAPGAKNREPAVTTQLRSDMKQLSDEQLLAKLSSLGGCAKRTLAPSKSQNA
jgi:hypothetical protein